MNPFLADPVDRVIRDPVRKLGWEDRLIGAIRLTLQADVEPVELTRAARLALTAACKERGWNSQKMLWIRFGPKLLRNKRRRLSTKFLRTFKISLAEINKLGLQLAQKRSKSIANDQNDS